MKVARLLFILLPALGACDTEFRELLPLYVFPVLCDSYYGPVDIPGKRVTQCGRDEICVRANTHGWVCAPGDAVLCNSELGATFLPPGVDPDPEAGYFMCVPGYRCLNPTDGTGFQCYPPSTQ